MKTDEANSSEFNELCKQAKGLGKQVKDSQEIASEDIQLFIHELQMNQLELEMRNGELHRIKQELEDSRNKYLDLFEFAPVGYFTIDKDGIILEVNLTGANLLGMERKHLIKTGFFRYVATDYHDTFYSYCKKLFETKIRQTGELKLMKNDGAQFYAQLESIVMWENEDNCSKFRTAIIDITERKQMEQELRESEEKFKVLAEQSPHMIFINKGGRVVYVNQRCEEITGYKRSEFYSPDFDFKSLVAPEFIEIVKSNFHKHMKGEEVEAYEYAIITKDGRKIEAIIATKLINYEGERAILGTVTDITKHKRTEEKLKQTMAELERSNAELEHFVHVISHDLQQPLRMMKGYLQLLERRYNGRLDMDAEECITYALDGANWMQTLIDDLLSYSRVGVCDKDFELTDCEAVFDRALANLQVAIEENEAVVTHDSLPAVTADVLQFTQLFQNLIGNAIKFRREEPPRVHVWAEQNENEWIFSVRDNGIGIEPKQADEIFGIFQRLHNRSEFPGTGVGLAICKKIVECHGGRIWVESEPGNGSTFYFTIPIKDY